VDHGLTTRGRPRSRPATRMSAEAELGIPGARADRIAQLSYDYAGRAKERVPACNLCRSTRHVEVARSDRYGYPATLQVCVGCGLAFLSPRMTADEYVAFYAETYRPLVSAYHGRTIDAVTVQQDQRGYAAELLPFLRHALPAAPATVIDIGGSTGIVGQAVAGAFGATATVLDPAPDELAVAHAAGMDTISGFAEQFDPRERRWDLALLCQTIDHLLDIRATLAAMRRLLTSDGRAFVDVLDFDFALRRHGVKGTAKIDHPFYLDRETALGFFQTVGFAVEAERLSEDGHWGFVLMPNDPGELPAARLGAHADAVLQLIRSTKAGA
jgi:hypothetical protein